MGFALQKFVTRSKGCLYNNLIGEAQTISNESNKEILRTDRKPYRHRNQIKVIDQIKLFGQDSSLRRGGAWCTNHVAWPQSTTRKGKSSRGGDVDRKNMRSSHCEQQRGVFIIDWLPRRLEKATQRRNNRRGHHNSQKPRTRGAIDRGGTIRVSSRKPSRISHIKRKERE